MAHMATTSTINTWLGELANSFINKNQIPSKQKAQLLTDFRRRVRRHSYGRTNQFEVEERLTGLEEKFQVLSLDDLSDALHDRRTELKEFEHPWLPDVLDLLVKLSGDSARNEKILDLYIVPPRQSTPPPLTWKDLVANDPIDSHDDLWAVPDFSADVEVFDDSFNKSLQTSPASTRSAKTGETSIVALDDSRFFEDLPADVEQSLDLIKDSVADAGSAAITELQAISETLLMLRGLPTSLFAESPNGCIMNKKASIMNLDTELANEVLSRVIELRVMSDKIQAWVDLPSEIAWVQNMKQHFEEVVIAHYKLIDSMRASIISPSVTKVVSLLQTITSIEQQSTDIRVIAGLVRLCQQQDSVGCLEVLYHSLDDYSTAGKLQEVLLVGKIFAKAFEIHAKPLWQWISMGNCDEDSNPFPIRRQSSPTHPSSLWTDWYRESTDKHCRLPYFLADDAQQILVAGKSAAFLNLLQNSNSFFDETNFTAFIDDITSMYNTPYLPFAPTFRTAFTTLLNTQLQTHTTLLRNTLLSTCGLSHTLTLISHIYLSHNIALLTPIENKLFSLIDHCNPSWNDRFLLTDLLASSFSTSHLALDPSSLSIHTTLTSSRTMPSRRQSVRILSSLTTTLHLPWHLSNIITPSTLHSYQRIALVLLQLRRALYSLQRIAYLSLSTRPLHPSATPTEQRAAQILGFSLSSIVATIYDHFTTHAIGPAELKLRKDLERAASMQEMVDRHAEHVAYLEIACLAAGSVRVLNQTLVAMLDLCIRFADLVGCEAQTEGSGEGSEAGSFTSARSRRKLSDGDDEDDEDEELGHEGYSSFIVLDEGTTIPKELEKVRKRFRSQLDFLVAGLNGTAKGRADDREMLKGLASRLEWSLGRL